MPTWLIVVLAVIALAIIGLWFALNAKRKKDSGDSVVRLSHRPRHRPPADPAHGVGVREPVVRPTPTLKAQAENTVPE
ncbi:MAG: hypothetical protein WAZ50_02945 [Minisyncoccia bacterium]